MRSFRRIPKFDEFFPLNKNIYEWHTTFFNSLHRNVYKKVQLWTTSASQAAVLSIHEIFSMISQSLLNISCFHQRCQVATCRARQDAFLLRSSPFSIYIRIPGPDRMCTGTHAHLTQRPVLGHHEQSWLHFPSHKKKIENKNTMQDNSRWANPFPNKTHLQSFSLPSPFPLFCCLLSAFPKCGFRSITRPSRGRKGKRKQVFDR